MSSDSPSSTLSKRSRSPSQPPLDNHATADLSKNPNGARKARSTVTKTQQEKDIRERLSEREKQRLEQANKRNARSERRRAEGMITRTPLECNVDKANVRRNQILPHQRRPTRLRKVLIRAISPHHHIGHTLPIRHPRIVRASFLIRRLVDLLPSVVASVAISILETSLSMAMTLQCVMRRVTGGFVVRHPSVSMVPTVYTLRVEGLRGPSRMPARPV